MNWLTRIRDEYSWILFLPLILLIGIVVILAVIGVRYGVIFFFEDGVFLTLIAVVGITPIIAVVNDYLIKSYFRQFGLGQIAR